MKIALMQMVKGVQFPLHHNLCPTIVAPAVHRISSLASTRSCYILAAATSSGQQQGLVAVMGRTRSKPKQPVPAHQSPAAASGAAADHVQLTGVSGLLAHAPSSAWGHDASSPTAALHSMQRSVSSMVGRDAPPVATPGPVAMAPEEFDPLTPPTAPVRKRGCTSKGATTAAASPLTPPPSVPTATMTAAGTETTAGQNVLAPSMPAALPAADAVAALPAAPAKRKRRSKPKQELDTSGDPAPASASLSDSAPPQAVQSGSAAHEEAVQPKQRQRKARSRREKAAGAAESGKGEEAVAVAADGEAAPVQKKPRRKSKAAHGQDVAQALVNYAHVGEEFMQYGYHHARYVCWRASIV